jgi:hypothetical protein
MLNLVTGTEILGRYVIQSMVGTGGYGSVWRAADKQLNRDVALKRLLKDGSATPGEEMQRLLEEARKHAQLVHTNIVQVYDVIESEGEHLIVMEFIDGPSLHSLLREHARTGQLLALDQAVSILEDVVAGVAFAHEKQIVHRDLSPSNILLTSTMVPKLGDFGIALMLRSTTPRPGQAEHGGTGNPNYMAPEQQRGEEADHSSDLFMVGIIGYLLLTGRHPFAHPSGLFGIPEFIRDDNFTPEVPKPPTVLTTSQQRLFREYASVVMRLLNRERSGRYASAREALASIEAVTPFQECPQCGERVPEHFTFCGYCGARVAAPAPALPKPLPTAVAVEPTVDELIEEGFVLTRDRRWDDAIARYRQALSREPTNQKALRNIGFALNRIRQHEEAEAALSRGLEIGGQVASHEASLRFERALARTELKKYDEALEDVKRSLLLVPHSVKALYLRARIHLYRDSLLDARRDAQEVLRAVPDHMGALRMIDQLSKERVGA